MRQRISLGAALAAVAGAGIVLSSVLGWTAIARPWGFILGFLLGVLSGIGVALAIAGLVECRRTG